MCEAVGQQSELLHQTCYSVEHRIDLSAEAIERVPGTRQRHPLRKIASTDPVRNGCDVANPLTDVVGKNHAAQQAEEYCDNKRDKHRALERVANCKSLACNPAARQPLARGKAMNDDGCNARSGLSFEADQRIMIALLSRKECRRVSFEVSQGFEASPLDERDDRLGITIGDGVLNSVVERRPAPGSIHVGKHLGLLGDLLPDRHDGIIVRAVIDEPNDREVGEQREQACQERDA